MGDRKPGSGRQEVGDWGEDQVRAILSDDQITVRSIDRDPGEDLSIEPDGRQATAEGTLPKVARMQVKGSRTEFDADSRRLPGVPLKQLLRWSVQQHPVFVVLVAGSSGKRIYARSVDDFLEERFPGRDLRSIESRTVTITLQRVDDLAAWVRAKIDEFYATLLPDFSSFTATQRSEHLEITESGKPRQGSRAIVHQRVVIWKGPRRPAYFAALVKELKRYAKQEIGGGLLPALVTFHIYRSAADQRINIAVARIDWFETRHPRLHPDLAHWDALKIRASDGSEQLREFWEARRVTPAKYLSLIHPLIVELDSICGQILSAANQAGWNPTLSTKAAAAERIWNEMSLAPAELEPVASFLSAYVSALSSHRTWALRLDEEGGPSSSPPVSEKRRRRWRDQDANSLHGFRGAVPLLIAAIGW